MKHTNTRPRATNDTLKRLTELLTALAAVLTVAHQCGFTMPWLTATLTQLFTALMR